MVKVVLLALLGCSQTQRFAAPARIDPGIPTTVWRPSFVERCEFDWLQPATHCDGLLLDYDGCRWRCVAPPIEGARQ